MSTWYAGKGGPPGTVRSRTRGDAAVSGAAFGAGAGAVGAVVLLIGIGVADPTPGLSAGEQVVGTVATSLILGLTVGAGIAVPWGGGAGALIGILNFVIARTSRGQSRRAVVAVGAGLAALLSAPVLVVGGPGAAPLLPGIALVPGMACAAHLRREQRLVGQVETEWWTGWRDR